ncbi:MAG: DUF6690 family protein [Pirellulaceae bacterium]
MPKPWVGALLLASAFGVPFFLFETPTGRGMASMFTSREGRPADSSSPIGGEQWWQQSSVDSGYLTSSAAMPDPLSAAGGASSQGLSPSGAVNARVGSSTASPLGTGYRPVQALREVVRFDISPNWIPNRFPRVNTVLSNMQLDGLRVPLVTGTQPTDLAGTLTYYFDRYKRVQRVTIHAVTGDPSRFVAELQHAYQMEQQPSLGGGLFMKKWNGRPVSLVYTAPAPVLTENNRHSRYQFFAELNQPSLEFGMSEEAQQLLQVGKDADRW